MKPVTAGKLQSGSAKVSNPFAEPLVAESKVASEDSARTNPGRPVERIPPQSIYYEGESGSRYCFFAL
jgi:hypothetical protein